MKNILTSHPDPEVRAAALRLLDALCMWERATSRHNVVIIKDSIGCGYRSFDGGPVPEDVSDAHVLESFQALYDAENPGEVGERQEPAAVTATERDKAAAFDWIETNEANVEHKNPTGFVWNVHTPSGIDEGGETLMEALVNARQTEKELAADP